MVFWHCGGSCAVLISLGHAFLKGEAQVIEDNIQMTLTLRVHRWSAAGPGNKRAPLYHQTRACAGWLSYKEHIGTGHVW